MRAQLEVNAAATDSVVLLKIVVVLDGHLAEMEGAIITYLDYVLREGVVKQEEVLWLEHSFKSLLDLRLVLSRLIQAKLSQQVLVDEGEFFFFSNLAQVIG